MSALATLDFQPLARAPRLQAARPTKAVRVVVTPRDSGSLLRFTLGQSVLATLAVTARDRVQLSFARTSDGRVHALLRRALAGQGVALRRRAGGASLQAQFQASGRSIDRVEVIEPPHEHHPDGGLVVTLSGEAAEAAWSFKLAADQVANAARARRLEGGVA